MTFIGKVLMFSAGKKVGTLSFRQGVIKGIKSSFMTSQPVYAWDTTRTLWAGAVFYALILSRAMMFPFIKKTLYPRNLRVITCYL